MVKLGQFVLTRYWTAFRKLILKINTKQMSKHLSEYSDKLYLIHECRDMLEMFVELVPLLVADGHEVQLENLCIFRQKKNKGQKTVHPRTQEPILVEASTTLQCQISARLQMAFKKEMRMKKLRGADKTDEEKLQKASKPFGHYTKLKRK